mgnify:CR=1 FL=1
MAKYVYNGPVMEFGKLLADHWTGGTTSPSEEKARNNLVYQFKKGNNRIPGSRITLPGKLVKVD